MKFVIRFGVVCTIFLFSLTVSAQKSDRDIAIDLYRQGKFTDAIQLLEKSVAANEGDRMAWMFLGGAYINAGEKDKAAKAFAKTNVRSSVAVPKYDKSVKITYKPRPVYTNEARRNMSSGVIRVAIEFRSDSTVGFVFPLWNADSDLIEPALQAAKGIKFEPAVKDGKPVTVINIAEYGFLTK